MALYPLALPLNQLRDNAPVQGRCAWLSAWTVDATVPPTLLIQDMSGNTRSMLVTLPVTVQTPIERVLVSNVLGTGTLHLLMSDDPCDHIAVGSSGAGKRAGDYEVDMMWPPILNLGVTSGFQQQGWTRYGILTGLWDAGFGVGLNEMTLWDNFLCARFDSNGAGAIRSRGMANASVFLPLTATGVGALFKYPAFTRVWIWEFIISLAAPYVTASGGGLTGVMFAPATGVAPGWPDGVGNAGFGLIGTGAGGWRYVEKTGGAVYQYSQPLVWPCAVTQWAKVTFEFLAATPISAARLRFYINDVIQADRTWNAAGVFLPTYAVPANAARFHPAVSATDPVVAVSLKFGAMRFRIGDTDVAGAGA